MRRRGVASALVNTGVDNVAAPLLYERHGFRELPDRPDRRRAIARRWACEVTHGRAGRSSAPGGAAPVCARVAGAARGGRRRARTPTSSWSPRPDDRRPVLVLVDNDMGVEVGDRPPVAVRGERRPRPRTSTAVATVLDPPATTIAPSDGPDDETGEPDDGNDEPEIDEGSGIDVVVTSYEPILERGRVRSVLAGVTGPAVDGARFDLADVLVADADPLRVELDVPTTTGGELVDELELPVAGLYPITVDLVTSDGRRLTRHTTFVERLASDDRRARRAQPFALSILAAVPDPGPEPDRFALLDARTRLVELAQLGEGLDGPLTISIPPVVAADLDDDAFGTRLRDALRGSEILAAPRVTFDPSAAVAADEVEAFTRELRDGEDLLARTFPATTVRRSAWLWDDPLSADGAAMLRDLGIALVVTSTDDYFALDGALPPEFTDPSLLYPVTLPGGGAMSVAMVDPVSELLDPERAALPGRHELGWSATDAAVEIVATLMAMRQQLPDAPRIAVLSTDGFGVPDTDVLAAVERFALRHPDIDLRALSYVPGSTDMMTVNGEPREVAFPASAGVDLRSRSDRIALARTLVDSLGSMLPDDDPRHGRWHRELDLLLSTGFTEAEADRRIDDVIEEVEVVPDDIHPPDPFTFTLTGQTSEVTLRLGNTGSTPLRLLLRPEASKLTFPEEVFEVELEPGSTSVTMPVAALSNGTFPVTIELLTPADRREITDPIVLTARVNALTGLGQVLTGGALVVLASWWFSHFRNHRRRASERARNGHPSNGRTGAPTASGSVASP
jgi:hypothetical protein